MATHINTRESLRRISIEFLYEQYFQYLSNVSFKIYCCTTSIISLVFFSFSFSFSLSKMLINGTECSS